MSYITSVVRRDTLVTFVNQSPVVPGGDPWKNRPWLCSHWSWLQCRPTTQSSLNLWTRWGSMNALVDSGWSNSFIHPYLASWLNLCSSPSRETVTMASFPQVTTTLGYCSVNLEEQYNIPISSFLYFTTSVLMSSLEGTLWISTIQWSFLWVDLSQNLQSAKSFRWTSIPLVSSPTNP